MSNIQGLPPLPQCFEGLVSVRAISESSLVDQQEHDADVQEGTTHCLILNGKESLKFSDDVMDLTRNSDNATDVEDAVAPNFSETPNSKLNIALGRLKSEMAGLRKLDVSLLYQLWTLHEAIQEYKHVMTDRYSDVGSEYSWGGLSSRASSITSIDSCDFDDFRFVSDPSIISSLQGSTTSLIQQIEQLKVRAETEF